MKWKYFSRGKQSIQVFIEAQNLKPRDSILIFCNEHIFSDELGDLSKVTQ